MFLTERRGQQTIRISVTTQARKTKAEPSLSGTKRIMTSTIVTIKASVKTLLNATQRKNGDASSCAGPLSFANSDTPDTYSPSIRRILTPSYAESAIT
jgi:hypothetical protein